MANTTINNGAAQPDYRQQLKEIAYDLMVKDGDIYRSGENDTKRIREEVAKFGVTSNDIFILLSYYIYRKYYVKPTIKPSSNGAKSGESTEKDEPVDLVTYKEIGGENNDYWLDPYWLYAPGLVYGHGDNNLVLRRGSEAAWFRSGHYAEYSTTTEDEQPLIVTNTHTHTFVQGAPTATYNWLFGKYNQLNDPSGYVRFYFNLVPTRNAAKKLSRAIKRSFNLYEIPFTLKFIAFSEEYVDRADTAVLYIDRRYLLQSSYLIKDIHRNVLIYDPNDHLVREATCLFVKPLLKGLSFGEDPENSDSFGTSRCKAIAWILECKAKGIKDNHKRYECLLKELDILGYDLDNFYKNPYSEISYQPCFDVITNSSKLTAVNPQGQPIRNYRRLRVHQPDEADWFGQDGKQKYLLAAITIAMKICKEAVWFVKEMNQHDVEENGQLQCSWMSYSQARDNNSGGYEYEMLYNDTTEYNSTQGVANFLCTVYKNYYDAEIFRKTSLDVIKEQKANIGIYDPIWYDEEIAKAWDLIFRDRENEDQKEKERIADIIIKRFLEEGRPLGNGLGSTDPQRRRLFNPTVRYGLAGLGYFFLKVYDPLFQVPPENK